MLSEALRRCIQARGISAAALAREIGQHRSTVTRWLNGERGLSEESLNKIATYLNLIAVPASLVQALEEMRSSIKRLQLLHGDSAELTDKLMEAFQLLLEENKRLRNQLRVASPATRDLEADLADLATQFQTICQPALRVRGPRTKVGGGRVADTAIPAPPPEHSELSEKIVDPISIEIDKEEMENAVGVKRPTAVSDNSPIGPSGQRKSRKKVGRD
jgi:transcriptional regulator with XRE-family HTH domain